MKISIVTAVKNGADVIRDTLESVAAQSYSKIEHIVVDGASTDSTLDVVKEHGTHVSTLISEPDTGVYDAFDKGLRLCTGDVVAFLNCGDSYTSPSAISNVVEEFSSKKVDSVFGDLVVVDPLDQDRVLRLYRSSRFTPRRVRMGFMPAHPTFFLKRDIYQRFGGYDSQYRIAGDFELIARLYCVHRISYSYMSTVLVRMPIGGLSSNGLGSNWIITKEMRRACAENAISTNYLLLLSRFPIKVRELFWRAT